MRDILVLGAGLVARPLLRYLLTNHDFRVYVATNEVERARRIMGDHPRGKVGYLDVHDTPNLAARLQALAEPGQLVIGAATGILGGLLGYTREQIENLKAEKAI